VPLSNQRPTYALCLLCVAAQKHLDNLVNLSDHPDQAGFYGSALTAASYFAASSGSRPLLSCTTTVPPGDW
jgi:hypothetical protein